MVPSIVQICYVEQRGEIMGEKVYDFVNNILLQRTFETMR